jgi:soluble lytic murein transglycosylase
MALELGRMFKEAFGMFDQTNKEDFKTPSPEQTAKDEYSSFENEMESSYPSKDDSFLGNPKTVVKGFDVDTIFSKLIQAESGGKQTDKSGKILTSKKGAEGITQVMPKTQKDPGFGVTPAKDKSQEEFIRVGKDYLNAMYDRFGDQELAVAAYNAGPTNVQKALDKAKELGQDWKDHLPKRSETLPYIDKILGTNYSEKLSKDKKSKESLVRDPYESEIEYFKNNPKVAGMATEDNKVILNPYSKLSDKEKQAVVVNETARIKMKSPEFEPKFKLTEEQEKYLNSNSYKNASDRDRKATIAARLLSGDPSAGKPTAEQLKFVEQLKK